MNPQVNYVQCNNLHEEYRMVYYAWGNPDICTQTMLCIHGLNRNGRDWDYVAQTLANQGYYVIAPDIVGRGNSDYLSDAKGYEIAYYVVDILKLIKQLSLQNVNLLGTSMGGLIGMAIAALPEHPLRKLILNDVGAELEYAGLKYISSYSGVQPEFDNYQLAKAYFMSITTEFGDLPAEVWEHMARHSFQINNNSKYELKRDLNLSKPFLGNVKDENNLMFWDYWHKVTLPTLVIRGGNSKLLSQLTVIKMIDTNKLTQSVEIPNAGHAPFLYTNEHCNMIAHFLE